MSNFLATKTACWVDDTAIRGEGAVKLVTTKGTTVAWVRSPVVRGGRWHYAAGRGGGMVSSKPLAIGACEEWARGRGYTIDGTAIEAVVDKLIGGG